MLQARTFGVDQVARLHLADHGDVGGENALVVLETRREFAHAFGPLGFIELDLGHRLHGDGGGSGAPVIGIVGLRHLHLGVGFDADEALGGGAIGAVGFQPEAALDGVGVVLIGEKRARGELPAVSPDLVVVVQLGAAHAHRHIERTALARIGGFHRAQCPGDGVELVLGYLVTHVVRRRVGLLFEDSVIAIEFLGHGVQQDRGLRRGDRRRGKQKQQAGGDYGGQALRISPGRMGDGMSRVAGFCANASSGDDLGTLSRTVFEQIDTME